MKYVYELVLVDPWSDPIAKWFVESEIEPDIMRELINKYSDHIREYSDNNAFLCITLVEPQKMPSLEEIMKCIFY